MATVDRKYHFLAAILNFRLKFASDKVVMCSDEKYVTENVGVAAGILFLSSTGQKL